MLWVFRSPSRSWCSEMEIKFGATPRFACSPNWISALLFKKARAFQSQPPSAAAILKNVSRINLPLCYNIKIFDLDFVLRLFPHVLRHDCQHICKYDLLFKRRDTFPKILRKRLFLFYDADFFGGLF